MAIPDAEAGTGGSSGDEVHRAGRRLDPVTVLVLVTAVVAISSSAVLVRWAEASALALSFWRTLGGSLILTAPAVLARLVPGRDPGSWSGAATGRPTRAQWRLMVVAGVALALHFGAWLASLELTSVAASVTLVSTAPILIAVWSVFRGHGPTAATWLAIGLAAVGTVIITFGHAASTTATINGQRPLVGNALALVGAVAMAVYLVAGSSVRRHLPTAAYASRTYSVAAATLLVTSAAAGVDLVGFDTTTWLVIGAMILGPQLFGHTGLNHLLRRLGSITVSLVLLAEPVAATALAWLLLDETPPVAAVVGGPMVIAAVALRLVNQDRAPARAASRL